MAGLALHAVGKRYGGVEAVRDVNLDVADGEFVVLVGPSGCGKSTLLRVIAGLEEISSGEILLDGRNLNAVAPRDRDMAMVFQDYALYPHMTVAENLGFALKMRQAPAREIDERVQEVARTLELSALLRRKPKALSGGQRQRVALGRALIRRPAVFLLDEPLSNLDAKLRVGMRMEIRRLQIALGTTTVYVTHDQVEAMTMADRIVILKGGKVQQIGTPTEVYQHPANSFVGSFIGSPPMGFVRAGLLRTRDGLQLDFGAGGRAVLPSERARRLDGFSALDGVDVGVRSEHVHLIEADAEGVPGFQFLSEITLVENHGADSVAAISLGDSELLARVRPGAVRVGQSGCRFHIDLAQIHLFHPDTGDELA